MRTLLLAAALLFGGAAAAHAETSCADLAKAKLPHAEVTQAVEADAGGKPACKILVTSRPSADSDIRIEVWIPRGEAWNGKYVQVGNGGLAGAVPSAAIRARAASGYAAAGTDDGHEADGRSAEWAYHHPEKIKDFAWRSLKATTDAAKALISDQKGVAYIRSYFVGCSAGGREALMEAQRFPNDFDGIVAGAPANYNTLGTAGRAYMMQALSRPGAYLGKPELELLQTAALKQCADGGAFIRDQAACRFDPKVLQCKAGQAGEACLTAPQVAAAKAIYSGRKIGERSVFPGYMPGGEALEGGWQAWITGPTAQANDKAAGYQFSSQVMKYFIYDDPRFDFLKADLGPKFDRDRQGPAKILDAVSPDLTAFARHGGKLIQYHGWNDPALAPRGSLRYAGELAAKMGDTSGFYRLYMVPGMLHCRGGAGPGEVDWLGVLDDWVSHTKPPAAIVASAGDNKQAAAKSQLLCPYPAVARGHGDEASGYRCETPKRAKKG
ncbi:tannase/feruloyl esterase family alpha/beta hydrolase [Phenylobacterium sp.]|uniref:tannase/feruloyl esterase family alpha/beta hydrolase n=1 Tax=Phenylobacterium sp. TaxID=1871053 RepID=UPI002DEE4727|nr:tannase/feruloyl esterase family alpha/beta hydrolase [Phenylobacterium sp.]